VSKRILIIDDEDDIREIVEVALQQTAGWQTLTASSAAEGIARARVELPDAILLDVMMPDVDGVTALARLRADERTATVPVILLTATVQIARAVEAGQAAGVILKPFDPLTLAHQVSAMLGWNPSASPNSGNRNVLLEGSRRSGLRAPAER
jgi:DNA-binding response OmpR family regulator